MTRTLRLLAAAMAAALYAFGAVPSALAVVPNPTVTGPIPENAPPGDPSHDYIFFTSDLVDQFGYVEEEFFIEGAANQYSTPPLATGTITSAGHPYKTRIVVRRPKHRALFNGTVILEWQNVTAGYDIDASWVGGNAEHFMRKGYVWVGVSAQQVGVHQPGTGLRDWSPVRYGSLDVTDGGTILDDSLSYDIFSQAGQAIMHPVGVDPLHGLHPKRILASGASQSASRLTIYYNSIHPLAGLFDGFFLLVGGGTLRGDLGTPAFKVFSETEINFSTFGFVTIQPDSDVLRTWQVAGAAHADRTFLDNVVANDNRDGIPTTPPGLCTFPEGSEVRFYHVVNAAHDHLNRWVKYGTLPPTSPAIEIDPGPPATIVRDDLGLAVGGIRLADIEAPTALNTGVNGGPSFCLLFGTHVPFDEATVDELYPTHASYVLKVWAATVHNVAQGYIGLRDAITTIVDAAKSEVGL